MNMGLSGGKTPAQRLQLAIAPVVAGFVDQAFGLREIAGDEVVIGEEEPHAGTSGDAKGLVEIVGRAPREEGAREVVEFSRAPEEVDGLVEVLSAFG